MVKHKHVWIPLQPYCKGKLKNQKYDTSSFNGWNKIKKLDMCAPLFGWTKLLEHFLYALMS